MKIVDITGSRFDGADKSVALLPVGSVERHGDHLPLGTDGTIPTHIAERAGDVLKCLVLPVVWYGSCKAMREFPGTFDIDSEALYKYLQSIMAEAHRNGVKLLVVINGHGGNTTPISMAARGGLEQYGSLGHCAGLVEGARHREAQDIHLAWPRR